MIHKDLSVLLSAYYALLPPRSLKLPSNLLASEVLDFFLNSILLGRDQPHLKPYPPSTAYQYTFWKWAIQKLEQICQSEDLEIDDRVYEHFTSLTLLPTTSTEIALSCPPMDSYVTYFFWSTFDQADESDSEVDLTKFYSITVLESRKTVESGTTGLRTWLASHVLAQYLILNPDLVADKQVLELGSGTGFLGIVIASLQRLYGSGEEAYGCVLTDVNDQVLSRCAHNIKLPCNISSSHPNINFRALDWSDAIVPPESQALRSFLRETVAAKLVLGADLVFDPSLIPALIQTLCIALDDGADAIIALTVRNQDTLAQFLRAADELLSVHLIDVQTRVWMLKYTE